MKYYLKGKILEFQINNNQVVITPEGKMWKGRIKVRVRKKLHHKKKHGKHLTKKQTNNLRSFQV